MPFVFANSLPGAVEDLLLLAEAFYLTKQSDPFFGGQNQL